MIPYTKQNIPETRLLRIFAGILALVVLLAILMSTIKYGEEIMAYNRNLQRYIHLNTIADAYHAHSSIDNNEAILIQDQFVEICAGTNDCKDLIDFSDLIEEANYLSVIPSDPLIDKKNEYSTGYFIKKSKNNRIILIAPLAEKDATIAVIK